MNLIGHVLHLFPEITNTLAQPLPPNADIRTPPHPDKDDPQAC